MLRRISAWLVGIGIEEPEAHAVIGVTLIAIIGPILMALFFIYIGFLCRLVFNFT